MSVLVISGYYCAEGESLPTWVLKATRNIESFAARNGYEYVFRTDCSPSKSSDTRPFYLGTNSKQRYILEAFENGYEVVFWCDPDTIILKDLDLFNLLGNKDICVSGDHNDLVNAGHIVARNTEWSRGLIQAWDRLRDQVYSSHPFAEYTLNLTNDGYSVGDQPLLNSLLVNGIVEDCDQVIVGINLTTSYKDCRYRLVESMGDFINAGQASTLRYLLHESCERHVRILPQSYLNGYFDSQYLSFGDLYNCCLIHFASNAKGFLSATCPPKRQTTFLGFLLRSPHLWFSFLKSRVRRFRLLITG